MRDNSSVEVIVVDDSSEDDGREAAAPPARRALIDSMDASSHSRSPDDGGDGHDEDFEVLLSLPTASRSLGDALPFRELQAQQIAFAQFKRQAKRRQARTRGPPSSRPRGSAANGKAAAKPRSARRDRFPSIELSPSPSSSLSPSSSVSSPRSESKVMKKSALTSPFEDAPPRKSASSSNESKPRASRWLSGLPPPSAKQVPQQSHSPPKPDRESPIYTEDSPDNQGESSDTEVLDDDDDCELGMEKTTGDTSNDDDFIIYEPKKPKTSSSTDSTIKQATPSRGRIRGTKKASKPKTKRHFATKSLSKASGSGKNAPLAVPELITDTLSQPRDAGNSIIHYASWREVYFDAAPVSVLSLDESISAEFVSEFERPLSTYDASGALEEKAKLLVSFGKAAECDATEGSASSEQIKSQEEVDQEIGDTVEQELPRLQELYAEKTRAILAESRAKTAAYLEGLSKHKMYGCLVSRKKLSVDPVEQKLIAELKQPVRLHPNQTTRMKFAFGAFGDDESETQELVARPQGVYILPKLRPLSKATTYVGVKANVRVEDDPIMQYVPYFGDQDDGAVIDMNNYDGIKSRDGSQRSGLDSEIDEYLLRIIVGRFGDSDKVFSALKTAVGFAQGSADYGELKKSHEMRRLAAQRISEAKRILDGSASKLSALTPLLQDESVAPPTLSARFAPPTTFFEANTARNFADREHGLGLRATSDYRELCITYRDLFCRMCYCYDCPEHGIEHPAPALRVDPVNPEVRLAPVILAKAEQNTRSDESLVDESPFIDVSESPEKANQEREVITEDDALAREDQAMPAYEIEEIVAAISAEERRRSSRSYTRISSLASANLKMQVARVETTKPARTPKPKPWTKMEDESEYLDESHCKMVSAKVERLAVSGEYCSESCWKRSEAAESLENGSKEAPSVAAASASDKLSGTELLLVEKLRSIIGDNACMIASVVKSTLCKDIYAFLASEKQDRSVRAESMDAAILSTATQPTSGRKRGRSAVPNAVNNRDSLKRTRYQRMKGIEANHEYEPCKHEGQCVAKVCSCLTRDHTCDKACSCARDCPNRFQGCRCSYGNCRTKACPCFVAMRECNPDMCVTCGASEAPVLVFSDALKHKSALELGICCNVNILRGLHKKIGVAFSTTHGWGAFAREPIKRGEFIYEYNGALLSQDEAERRGSIYDKMTISFLFDANEDSVVDAIRMGNKSKFANHASVGQKCQARVMRVGGEHRISIWAKQDIEKGEELFFDYGYHGDSAPDWSQLRIKGASTRHARGYNSDNE